MDLDNSDALDVTIVQNPETLSSPDLAEEYQKLSTCYVKQKQRIERFMQQIYTLKQDKALKDKLLDQELQEITENYERELSDTKNKHMLICEELQNRLMEERSTNERIELENQRLRSELEEKISQLQVKADAKVSNACNDNETVVSNKRMEYLIKVESEYADLTEEIAQINSEKSQLKSRMAQIENELEDMKECYECSQQNLKYKTDELVETQHIVDSMQEKLVGVENELLSYKNGDTDHNKKGNSLFAEVDDQRQQMRDILSRQKQQYQTMKLKYERSSGEINRLKRENADMLNEIKECVNMFKNAEKFAKSKLNEHIGFLKTENNRLSEKLKQTQLEMDTLAKTQGVNWLSSMLEYCENETKELNSKLMSYGMKKCEAEGLYVQAQERAAKWRFEALKSRCVIMNREMLLESNNISFDSKLPNMRQLVERQFGPNEEPIIDDVPCFSDCSLMENICASKPNDGDLPENDVTEGWSDVKEIISNINGRLPTTENTPQIQRFESAPQDDNTILMLPGEESVPPEKYPIIPTNNTDSMIDNTKHTDFVKRLEVAERPEIAESIENKENISHLHNKLSNSSIGLSPEKMDETMSISCPSILTNNSEHHSANDSQHRVRQVNVEMFTVTLKRRDSPKEQKMISNKSYHQ